MPATKRPINVIVGGRGRNVVQSKPTWWIETTPDGHLVHCGRLLAAQDPAQILAEPKKCGRCKRPAVTATARGRAYHSRCEGWLEVLPDDIANQVIFGVAADLHAAITAMNY